MCVHVCGFKRRAAYSIRKTPAVASLVKGFLESVLETGSANQIQGEIGTYRGGLYRSTGTIAAPPLVSLFRGLLARMYESKLIIIDQ